MKESFYFCTGRTDWKHGSDPVRQGDLAVVAPLQSCMPFSALARTRQPGMQMSSQKIWTIPNNILKFSLKDEHYLTRRAETASASLTSNREKYCE